MRYFRGFEPWVHEFLTGGVKAMKDIDYLELIYTHRAEMKSGGFYDLLKKMPDIRKPRKQNIWQWRNANP